VAYYAIFSIGPLLLISITIVSLIYGKAAANDQVRPHLAQFLGDKVAASAQQLLAAAHFSPALSLAGIISIILLTYAATNLFASLQSALNTIFDVEPRPGRGILAILRDRAMTFLMVLIIGLFVLATIVLNTALATVASWGNSALFAGHSSGRFILLQVVSFVVSCIVFTGVFALLFKYLPDVKIDWRDTLIGAACTAIAFTLVRIGLGFYLGRSSTAGPFGAAGSLVIVMLFAYYSAQILFFGAEFTQVWACRRGKPITPSRSAIFRGEKFRQRQNGINGKLGKNKGPTGRGNQSHWWPATREVKPSPMSIDHRRGESFALRRKPTASSQTGA
jgi:membrane protein